MKNNKQRQFKNMGNINPKLLFQMQLILESFDIDHNNRIIKIKTNHFDAERKETDDLPKIKAVKFGRVTSIYYSVLICNELLLALNKLGKNDFFYHKERVIEILKRHNQYKESEHCVTYIFEKEIEVELSNTKIFYDNKDKLIKEFDPSFYGRFPILYAVMQDDKIVSCCVSARENNIAGEAWSFTPPDHRKQGFGSTAVKLWANELIKKGKVPFYSHKITNKASYNLAKKLDLKKVFEIINYE